MGAMSAPDYATPINGHDGVIPRPVRQTVINATLDTNIQLTVFHDRRPSTPLRPDGSTDSLTT